MSNFKTRDLWWEARQKSAKRYKGLVELSIAVSVSLRGRATKRVFNPSAIAQRPDVVLMPDLNKYRIRDLKPYIDFGCKAFMFRMGGPGQWVDGDWKYTLDPTFRDYITQAYKYGVIDQTIGYIVHNPFEYWTENSVSHETVHTQLVDEWTQGGFMPKAFCYDHEVGTCYRSTGAPVTVTVPNLITSLATNTDNTYKKFKRTVSIYSANWFMRNFGWTEHDTYFHNVNLPTTVGGPGTQRPLMEAWYSKILSKIYPDITTLYNEMTVPTPEQVGAYLYCGYQADSWQFTDRLKVGTDSIGVDCSISLGNPEQFYYTFGLVQPGVTPPVPDTNYVLQEEYDANKIATDSRLDKLEQFQLNVKNS